jgi:hypothetical protein
MLENMIKWVGTFAPFLAPYPIWVKLAFAICILAGATCGVGLVVAAPNPSSQNQAGDGTAWLTIKGVTGFGSISSSAIRVTATVNDAQYVYPSSVPDVDWLQISPNMSAQSFQIPASDNYRVRFAAKLRDGITLVSVEEQRVNRNTDGVKTYQIYTLNENVKTRDGAVTASIKYTISQQP